MSKCGLALITGASRGIGLAIAKKLIGEGYAVIGTATSESGANFIEKDRENSITYTNGNMSIASSNLWG